MPSPVYQWRKAFRRNIAVNCSEIRLKSSWIAVLLPKEEKKKKQVACSSFVSWRSYRWMSPTSSNHVVEYRKRRSWRCSGSIRRSRTSSCFERWAFAHRLPSWTCGHGRSQQRSNIGHVEDHKPPSCSWHRTSVGSVRARSGHGTVASHEMSVERSRAWRSEDGGMAPCSPPIYVNRRSIDLKGKGDVQCRNPRWVSLTRETKAGGNTWHRSRDEVVQIAVGWCRQFQRAEANIVQSFVVNAIGLVGVFDQLMHWESGIVGFDDCVRHFGWWHNTERVHDA